MATLVESCLRRLPKTPTDLLAFLFLLFGIHAVLGFELLVVLPFLHAGFHTSDTMWYGHVLAALFLYVNTVSSIVQLMRTETGIRGVVLLSTLRPGWRFCAVCECNAPPRSFHCSTCRTCVLKRDHHCVFAGCCVGFANQRYFLTMIAYLWVAALYACVMNVDFVYHVIGEFSPTTVFVLILPLLAWLFQVTGTVTTAMAFMISLCLITFLLTTALLGYHMGGVVRNQTVSERNRKIVRYDVGVAGNLRAVFGARWAVCWLSPWLPSPLDGCGLEFPEGTRVETEKDR